MGLDRTITSGFDKEIIAKLGVLMERMHAATAKVVDAAAGDKVSAINTLQSLLDEGKNFTEKTEAQQLLTRLQAGAFKATH